MTINTIAARYMAADLKTAHAACDKDGACLRCAARGVELADLVPQLCDALDAARAEILAVESLLTITDGDPLGDRGIAIPLSEIRRVLAEARAGVSS